MKPINSFIRPVAGSLLLAASLLINLHAEGEQPKPYPLAKCVVSGEAFEGSSMTPYQFVYQGQTVKLCCKGCLEDFEKEPAKYLRKIEEGAKKKQDK